jgi:hypothetical protein
MPSLASLAAGLAAFAVAPAAAHNVRAGTAHCDIDAKTGTFRNPVLCGVRDWKETYAHALTDGEFLTSQVLRWRGIKAAGPSVGHGGTLRRLRTGGTRSHSFEVRNARAQDPCPPRPYHPTWGRLEPVLWGRNG